MSTSPAQPPRHPELQKRIEEARPQMKHHGNGQWTDNQLLASYAIASLQGGYHHIYSKIKPAGQNGIETSIYGTISTFDHNWMTRAVLISHQMGVRIEIGQSAPRMLKVYAYTRVTSDQSEGPTSFYERHPSLDNLIETAQKWKLPEA